MEFIPSGIPRRLLSADMAVCREVMFRQLVNTRGCPDPTTVGTLSITPANVFLFVRSFLFLQR